LAAKLLRKFPNNTDSQKKFDLKQPKKANQESISLVRTYDANMQHEARNPSQTRATCTNGAAREETEGTEGEERRREREREEGRRAQYVVKHLITGRKMP
jgi:hypothetical protein